LFVKRKVRKWLENDRIFRIGERWALPDLPYKRPSQSLLLSRGGALIQVICRPFAVAHNLSEGSGTSTAAYYVPRRYHGIFTASF